MNPWSADDNAYSEGFRSPYIPDELIELYALDIPDDKLHKLLISNLDENVDYWNKSPWNLQTTDEENVKFLLGDQWGGSRLSKDDEFVDNRLFAATRAILSYATGQLAVPEVTPSRSDDNYVRMARAIQSALYQHSLDEKVADKARAAVMNLLTRKRGYLKLRFDPNVGLYGDIVTDVCNPEDIIIDRNAAFMSNPNAIYHRLRCSVDELCSRFPDKADAIKSALQIKQARYSQMSRMVTYFECWFTYLDDKGIPREGVAWFLNNPDLILDKIKNPNWVYTGDDRKDKETNVTFAPPKPFTSFNYLNLGHSYIDETCLFDQAKPLQIMLNRRGKQIWDNADYVNGRWVGNKSALSEEDAQKIVNKGPKTVALVDAEDVTKAFANISSSELPTYVYNTMLDTRNEIDTMMGTPSIFRGGQPENQDTLGRDMMVKQQAGMLQDDLVRAISSSMEDYYKTKLQMMRVYYTEDYWFQVKGGDGKFDFIMLNGDSLDANVKVGVQVDSTLPLNKEAVRANAMMLAKMNRIDQLTLLEDLGLPNPEIRTERFLRSQIDLYTYMQSVEQSLDNNDAEVDIMLLVDGKFPEERDNYDQGYLEYFNHFITTNRFSQLSQDAKTRLITFLQAVTVRAQRTSDLQSSMLNDAGIINRPPIFPLPKRTENIRLTGNMSPEQTQQIAGSEGQMFTPIDKAEAAQDPNAQAASQAATMQAPGQ